MQNGMPGVEKRPGDFSLLMNKRKSFDVTGHTHLPRSRRGTGREMMEMCSRQMCPKRERENILAFWPATVQFLN